MWHSINESGEISVYDVEWPNGELETNIPAYLLEGVKDSDMVSEVHEAHGVQEEDQPEKERKYKKVTLPEYLPSLTYPILNLFIISAIKSFLS